MRNVEAACCSAKQHLRVISMATENRWKPTVPFHKGKEEKGTEGSELEADPAVFTGNVTLKLLLLGTRRKLTYALFYVVSPRFM